MTSIAHETLEKMKKEQVENKKYYENLELENGTLKTKNGILEELKSKIENSVKDVLTKNNYIFKETDLIENIDKLTSEFDRLQGIFKQKKTLKRNMKI